MTRRLWLTVAVLVGGFALRVWRINAESIWHDEGWSIRAIRGPFTTPDDNTPYGYYTLGHLFWRLGTGESPLAFRYTSVLMGIITVALAMRLAWRWYGVGAGLATGVLVASSPLLWDYAQEVRAYVAVPLIALLLVMSVGALLAHTTGAGEVRPQVWAKSRRLTPEAKIWLGLWLTELLGLYTHNLTVPLIVWASVAVGVVWLTRRYWSRIMLWGAVHCLLILAYLPWLLTQSPSGTPLNTPPRWGFSLIQDIWYSYFLPVLPQWQATPNDLWLNLAGFVLLLSALILIIRTPTTRTWLLLSHITLVPFFSTLLLRTAHIDFHPRYYIAAVPATLLVLVAGLAQMPIQRRMLNVALAGVVIGGLGLSQSSLHAIASTRAYQHDDFAGLAAYYATLPPEAVIIVPFEREPALQSYYARHADIRAQFMNIPLHSTEAAALEQLAILDTPLPVEFLTWFQLPADVRGMYPCLLAASSNTISETQTFYGLETHPYTLSQVPSFTNSPEPVPTYAHLTLEQVGWIASPHAICIRTTWRANSPPPTDISLAMRLLNDLGWLLDQSDTIIRDAEQHTDWQQGASYHLLHLPSGAPRAIYPLEWSIYSDLAPHGYDLFDATGASLGVSYRLEDGVQTVGSPLVEEPAQSQIIATNADPTLDSGTQLEVTLLLAQPAATLTLVGTDWQLSQSVAWQGAAGLSWHQFRIPPDAQGEAILRLDDATPLATYTIHTIERIFDLPVFDVAVEAEFVEVGRLVGVSVPQTQVSSTVPFALTLGWQATAASDMAYTVFAQLLDESGRVLAQSDSQPANAERPTTSWLPNEYIVDNHQLTFRVNDYRGAAYLIVGFYDPLTFERVLTTDGSDHVRLPLEIAIE